jgi:hypothetical protein
MFAYYRYEFRQPFGSAEMIHFFKEDDYFNRPSVKPHYLRKSMALKVKQTLYPTLLSMWITAMQSIWVLGAE